MHNFSVALYAVQDCETLFFGPKKYIQDLQVIISHQKEYIKMLERKLHTLGFKSEVPHRRQEATGVICTHCRIQNMFAAAQTAS